MLVKQMPSRRDVTNAWGIFALEPLPAGSYTLSFKARPANKSKGTTSDKVIVATIVLDQNRRNETSRETNRAVEQ